MSFAKVQRYENKAYRRYVAGHDCFGCGISGFSQCAHANGGGMGTKRSDLETFPLCCTRPGHVGCHFMHDQLIDMTRADRRELEVKYIAKMQAIAREDGRPELRQEQAA